MAESKTARASRVSIGEVKKDPFDTPEKKISELRKQREAKLAVVRYDFIDALLVEFDKVQLLLAQEIANVVVREAAIELNNYTIKILTVENSRLVEQRDSLNARPGEVIFTYNEGIEAQVAEAKNNRD